MSAKSWGEECRAANRSARPCSRRLQPSWLRSLDREPDADHLRKLFGFLTWTPCDWEDVADGLDSTRPWEEQVTDFPDWLADGLDSTRPWEERAIDMEARAESRRELETTHQRAERERRKRVREQERELKASQEALF